MWFYWVLYGIPALAAFEDRRDTWREDHDETSSARWTAGWWLAALALFLVMGFRFEVGGDWYNYSVRYDATRGMALGDMLALGDPGYQLISWAANAWGWGFVGVNAMGALLFVAGLMVFCRALPRPWLALAIAVPYVLVVVGMGYSRQAIALGLAMLGLASLMRGSTVGFVAWVVLGATFHRSAVILVPIAALASTRNRYWTAVWVAAASLAAYSTLLESSVDQYVSGYVDAEMQSEGALVRLAMNALPAALLLFYRSRFSFTGPEERLWPLLAVIAILLIAVLPGVPSSTALDRIGLYLLPLQLIVFAQLPEVMGARERTNSSWVLLVIAFYAVVQFTWLNFAANHIYWLPYRSALAMSF